MATVYLLEWLVRAECIVDCSSLLQVLSQISNILSGKEASLLQTFQGVNQSALPFWLRFRWFISKFVIPQLNVFIFPLLIWWWLLRFDIILCNFIICLLHRGVIYFDGPLVSFVRATLFELLIDIRNQIVKQLSCEGSHHRTSELHLNLIVNQTLFHGSVSYDPLRL